MSRELLRDALAVWRETGDPEIAEAIDRLTAELIVGWEPPAVARQLAYQVAWLGAAADEVTCGWAAQHLLARLGDRKQLRGRLAALIGTGPDPRVSRELAAHVEALHPDERALAELVLAPPVPRRAATVFEHARFAPRAVTPERATLEREVYAHPDADEPRAVLADLLQGEGDPRGELIALQLAPPSDEGAARIAALVREHGHAWLGPLRDIARAAELRRGFVARLELAAGSAASWERVIDHPMLGTIEELIPGEATGPQYAALIASPAMRALRRIEVFDPAVVRALERVQAPLEHVACPAIYATAAPRLDEVLQACARFAALRSIACLRSELDSVMRSPIAGRLTRLTIVGELASALAFARHVKRPIEVTIAPHARLPACTPVAIDGQGSIRVRREAGRIVLRLAGPWAAAIYGDDPARLLPADRLELVEPFPPAARARLALLGVEIVKIPQPHHPGVVSVAGG